MTKNHETPTETPSGTGVVESWQWVPKEPTAKQIEHGGRTYVEARTQQSHGVDYSIAAAYRAMIAAAPHPDSQPTAQAGNQETGCREPTEQMMPGPCGICGAQNYPLSMGGPTICPKCDCGHFDAATVQQQAKVIERLRAELAFLRSLIRNKVSGLT